MLIQNLAIFAAETADKAEESAEGIAALGIDPIAIVLQLGTFLVLFFFLTKFGLNKIVDNLKERQETIDEGLKNAHEIELQKAKLEKDNEKIAKQARSEADAVINKSHEEAGAIVAEAQSRAQQQADDIVAKAKAQAEQEISAMRTELKKEMLALVSQATESVLDKKIDSDTDKQLIQRSIEEGAKA